MSFCGLKQALLCGGGKKGISNNTIISSYNNNQSKIIKSNQNNAEDLNIDKAKKRDNNQKKPISNQSIFDEDILLDEELTLQFSSTLNTTTNQQQQRVIKKTKSQKKRLLLNMSRNAAIIDDNNKNENVELYKLLQQCSLSKSANIPMIVVKTFIPNNDINDDLVPPPPQQTTTTKFAGLRLFANITKHKQFKQIEIHRGMTINALFSRENWLYIKTAQNESGYVPLDTCKPVIFKRQQTTVNNKTKFIDATNVSLLDISQQEQILEQNIIEDIDEEMVYCDDEDENLSELEFSQYDNKNINEYIKLKQQQLVDSTNDSQHDSIRLFKIKHYFKSLQIETNLLDNISVSTTSSSVQQQQQQRASIALDSGYSDTDSNIMQSRYFSQSYELLSQCSKPAQRRGIKTNGSICSISPNNQQADTISKAPSVQSLNVEQESIEQEPEPEKQQQDIVFKTTRPNLSTIIEQSYSSACELQRAVSNSLLANNNNNSLIHSINKCDLSNFHSINTTKNSSIDAASATVNSCYRQIIEEYVPLFVEDLAVTKGELVTVLEDENPEWCYVISQNGKGYIPRNCIQFEINL